MSRQIFTLGQRYWDAQTGSLYSGLVEGIPDENTRVKLTNKQQLLLKALMEAHPNILSYEELTREVWFGRVMSPESLPQLINRTRTALGDSDKGIIVNHPGSGYSLNLSLYEPPTKVADETPAQWRKSHIAIKFAVVCLLIGITGFNTTELFRAYREKQKFTDAAQRTPYPRTIKDETGQVKALMIGDTYCEYDKAKRLLNCNF
ncbi:winged helix-turn-helix domain-containing protein [Shewanella submarina]|uniref:Transcriptional regulator n=1 Tax=Shewanella submarina TaxID=2016376 RepID=A0ABV7GA49_9GAMM|nr:winged helix-turn-helix domain-containing protein [Shewanella submarina]MCL1037500.1 winged helix-turn-helix domain-containing protein [Shewanella submarina]